MEAFEAEGGRTLGGVVEAFDAEGEKTIGGVIVDTIPLDLSVGCVERQDARKWLDAPKKKK